MLDLLAELHVRPVKLVFGGREGFTLWGGNVDGDRDFFLTGRTGKVLLADSPADLQRRLRNEGGGRLTLLPGFEAVLTSDETLTDAAIDRIDFVRASAAIQQGPQSAANNAGTILTCLNSAADLARQLRAATVLNGLRDTGAPLRDLYHFLWDEADAIAPVTEFGELTAWFTANLEPR
ncbi:hypothetical protein FB565_008083 [Actinoplanes lutulentus]|uniref:hypothetical protein n=1 Tax=Actinoplanes lutulentus TaxID=1287878 RepID=UPI0011B934DE|nr:hypothetical protein [Actinoplanes lutulentus]MBB2948300.1 hypothetical protein [Actinoplanes lutulentus]